tara:strand:- start:18 stop:725 length:708 start_codon:yes stop_codon:yes gene_type:complete
MYKLSIEAKGGFLTDDIQRVVDKQLPFAASMGLNELLFSVQKTEVLRVYEKAFDKRNDAFFNLVNRVYKSNKRQLKQFGFLTASIQRGELPGPAGSSTKPIASTKRNPADTSFMLAHARGGVRKPLRSKKAVPMTVGGARISRSKTTGKVRHAQKASTLYAQDNTFVRKSTKTGKSILFRRVRKKIVPVYHFEAAPRNRRKYNIDMAVELGVKRRARFHIARAYIKAIKTARYIR